MPNLYTYDHLKAVREHPEILCRLCGKDLHTKLHGDWIKLAWDNKGQERLIFAHRASMKTSAVTEVGTIWRLLFNPDDVIFIVRKTYTEAAENVRNIVNMMMIPEVSELLRLSWFGPKSKEKWEFTTRREGRFDISVKKSKTKESSVMGFGIDSQFTGYHNTSGICDDIVTLRDRLSQADRDRTKIVVQELRSNIIARNHAWSFIGTPWKDGNEETGDAYKLLPEPLRYPPSVTKLLTDEQLEDIRNKTTKTLFSINYALTFDEAEDQLFNNPVIGTFDWGSLADIQAHLDASYQGKHTSALTIMGRMPDGKLGAIGWTNPGNVKEWLPFVLKKLTQYKVKKFHCENNADRGFVLEILRRQPSFKEAHIWPCEYREDTNKTVKIASFGIEAWPDTMWHEDTDPDYLAQLTTYLEGQEPDDCCFVAGTKISTIRGDVPIEQVRVGDLVITPDGLHKVLVSKATGRKQVITNASLTGTPSHKVFSSSLAKLMPLDSLTSILSCDRLSLGGLIRWQMRNEYFLMVNGMSKLKREDIISAFSLTQDEKGQFNFIRLFGSFITKQKFHKGFMFIIRILIKTIMTLLIWSCWRLRNIWLFMQKKDTPILNIMRKCKKCWRLIYQKRQNGMEVLRDENGINNIQRFPWLKHGKKDMNALVYSVDKSLCPVEQQEGIALKGVETDIEQSMAQDMSRNVSFVEKSSLPNKKIEENTVPIIAKEFSERNLLQREVVYNLTVDGVGLYYANGILVSNCDSYASLIREGGFSKAKDLSKFMAAWNW